MGDCERCCKDEGYVGGRKAELTFLPSILDRVCVLSELCRGTRKIVRVHFAYQTVACIPVIWFYCIILLVYEREAE